MRHPMIPDVFEIPEKSESGNFLPWFSALAAMAIIIGATLALVAMNESATSQDPQVTVSR